MTYKEWITKSTGKFNIEADDVELILCNQSELIPDPEAEVDIKTAKTALCKEFAAIIPLANISEGGLSVTWNMDAIKLWYNSTCSELGVNSVMKPKIRNKSNVW